ncbi:unnamed protein product [Paramecium octaurelia]|uniref:Uncharacterized protein n=1 Tax=Paramecium octaurelia TaxID=43137 RepID=A0A8S1TEI0_PAROT|nr:unnamed protein product [Paramecium octaurelia]
MISSRSCYQIRLYRQIRFIRFMNQIKRIEIHEVLQEFFSYDFMELLYFDLKTKIIEFRRIVPQLQDNRNRTKIFQILNKRISNKKYWIYYIGEKLDNQ